MANVAAVHSVGDSLVTYLRNAYPEPLRTDQPCEFRLLSSGELDDADQLTTAVTPYLYRVVIDEQTRNLPDVLRPGATPYPLSLCLYYLFIVWAGEATAEHTLTAWVMSELNQHPILDRSNLSATGGWGPHDQIHIVPIDMTNEDLMRIWDAITPSYRLSLPYLARVVRIDPDEVEEGLPVVATRYRHGELVDAEA